VSRAGSILRLEHISLAFGGVPAIVDLGLEVAAGEICALIGPNGAGKSSLLNVINGLYRAQAGTITYDGVTRRHMRPCEAARRGIARTFQNIALFKGMSVAENLATGRTLHARASVVEQALRIGRARADERALRAAIEPVLELLELRALRDATVGKLPYGLQKRVELGRALAAQPKLLLLDEPMAGLTFEEKREMSGFVAQANRRLGTTVVLIEHDMGVVMELAQHVVVLDYGRKIGDGPPAEVREQQEVIDAYLGVAHEAADGAASAAPARPRKQEAA
jgi:branched-chain amino acid transport system ATP-binding protein